jgi:hypothetical protein
MPIIKPILTDNGMTSVHLAVDATLVGDMLRVRVHMYPNQDQATDRFLLWQDYETVPLTALNAADPWGSIEQALVSTNGGMFSGGTVVPLIPASSQETA